MRTLVGFITQVFSGLRFRLLVLVVLTCAPLVALMLRNAGEDRRRAMAGWTQRAQRLQQVARKEEQQVIGSTRQLLLAFSEASSVHSQNSRRCKKAVDELFAAYPRYANLGGLTTNGEVLASALPIVGPENRADRDFFRAVLENRDFSVGKAFISEHGSAISFGSPVLDSLGMVEGVVFAELDLAHFGRSRIELANQLPKAATWTQIDRHGTILARYPAPEDWIGHQFPEPQLLANVFASSNGLVEAASPERIPNLYAFNSMPSRLGGGEVVTILGIPKGVLFADADRVLRRNVTWLGAAAAIAILLGWIGSKLLILRPVRALVRSSMRLARGDFSVRTGLPHGRDELGQLTLAFDHMAQALEQRELERQRASHKLQVLSHRLVEVQETERRHIARELHDEIGQSLTATEMNLQAALQAPGTAAVERRLEDSIKAVERV